MKSGCQGGKCFPCQPSFCLCLGWQFAATWLISNPCPGQQSHHKVMSPLNIILIPIIQIYSFSCCKKISPGFMSKFSSNVIKVCFCESTGFWWEILKMHHKENMFVFFLFPFAVTVQTLSRLTYSPLSYHVCPSVCLPVCLSICHIKMSLRHFFSSHITVLSPLTVFLGRGL